jgi:hypothetical protein
MWLAELAVEPSPEPLAAEAAALEESDPELPVPVELPAEAAPESVVAAMGAKVSLLTLTDAAAEAGLPAELFA